MFWDNSYRDIRTRSRLKVGFELARVHQEFQTFATVARYALGGEAKEEKTVEPPANLGVAQRQLAAVLGKG